MAPRTVAFRRWAERLGNPRAPWIFVALGVALGLPSIGSRFVFDDNTHALLQRSEPGVVGHQRGVLDLFVFANGDVETVRAMVREGVLAWWTVDGFKNAFWRPLSSLTHVLDGTLWPDSAALMHVHSLAWYAALLVAAAAVYRRMAGAPWVAGLALLGYAIDDAHGHTVGWNANRNAIVASTFALVALAWHHDWRRLGKRSAAVLGPVAFGVALLSGEIAVGVAGYLLAYALFLDPAPLRARALSLLPYGALALAWRVTYVRLGYGSWGSDAYVDPGGEPLAFLAVLPWRLAMLLMGQLGAPGSDLAFVGRPDGIGLLALPAAATLAAAATVAWPALRGDARARFWALAMVLSAVPVSASFSSDRHLVLVGIGGMGLLATALARFLESQAERTRLRAVLLLGFGAVHLVAAPLLFPVRAKTWNALGEALDRADASLPSDAAVRGKTIVIANPPIEPFASWLHVMRARRGTPRPEAFYSLAVAASDLTLTRASPRELVVEPERGYFWTEPERLLRGRRHPLAVGDRVELASLTAMVEALTPDGRPARVRFTLHEAPDSGRYVFVKWERGVYVPLQLPAEGDSVRLEAQDLFGVLRGAG